MKSILISVRNELEEYKKAQYEDNEDLFKEEREKCNKLFDMLLEYDEYEIEEVEIETKNDFSVIYMPNSIYELNSSPIIKDVCKNNQGQTLINMIESIKKQEFKGLKRFAGKYTEFYELRLSQQRVVFHFLTPNTAVIISAFTKKSDNAKKYRLDLANRINKYKGIRNNLKKLLKKLDTEEINKYQRQIEQQFTTDANNKVLVKEGAKNG